MAVVALLLLIVRSLPGAEAAGFWGLGSGRAGHGFLVGSDGPDDDDMAEVFAKFQEEQLWEDVEYAGMEVLEEEVAEKKTKEIFAQVAKGCSVGAQMTLIMGGGALLFRLLPILLGHDLDDDEGDDANSPYLLQLDGDRPQHASLDLPRGRRQPLLTNVPNEDAGVRLHGEETEGDGTAVVVGLAVAEGEGEGGGGALVAEAGGGVVVATRDGAEEEEEEEEEVGDVDVVVETRLRVSLRKARRLSRPFLKAMAPPLALLLVARLALGTVLARRIDPTLELLFGDDVMDLYSTNKKVINKVDMPFAKDAQDVPGRKKMKGKGVQRRPRPDGEEGRGGEGVETESEPEADL
ncbi:expressed unknown protein [Ectocarpus siliculosus]|uniref:Uncharacterized protein n=1 Tax=Ectocarpus siliculosus TaxID=2880 RepID=D8LMQ9_ECTSI|nr:expressed unknown protein [Ectocarpus siliculosus]|eukprot:CBN74710.1 expressed unknown protein [Ectocarpus siliculosus]